MLVEAFDGIIGVDLGTTNSCVGVFLNGQVHIVPNDQGNLTTPSRVAIVEKAPSSDDGGGKAVDILVGDTAMDLSAIGENNVVYDAKRLIGRSYADVVAQNDQIKWPFAIKEAPNGGGAMLVAETKRNGESLTREWEPEEVSAIVLKYLKECAERFIGKTVSRAVITVPTYFNDEQKERTRAAGRIAGLEVVRIIDEPTAAALAYGIGYPQAPESATAKNVLVFAFGGRTFHVSIVSVQGALEGGAVETRSRAGDMHLGGQDIDEALMDHVIEAIQVRYKCDLTTDRRSLAKLRLKCEKIKKSLSFAFGERMDVTDLVGGNDEEEDDTPKTIIITRSELDNLNMETYKKCMNIVKKAVQGCTGITKKDIHEIFMVGGSSRIPFLQRAVRQYFGGKALYYSGHPDDAVAAGAAIQGSILSDLLKTSTRR